MINEIKNQIKEAKKQLNNYNFDECYNILYDICIENGKEWLIDDIITSETAEEIAKNELYNGGIDRLYYFFSIDRLAELYRINGYGNLENIDKDDLENIIDELEKEFDEVGEDD